MKENSNADTTSRHAQQLAADGDQGILLTRLLLRSAQAVLVLLAVAELETVNRLQVRAQLVTAVGIQEDVDTRARADTHVMVALGANVQGLFQLRAVQHRVAGRAFVPQTFRNRAFFSPRNA